MAEVGRRDFVAEITEALQASDAQRLARIALDLCVRSEAAEAALHERRTADADRQRRRRQSNRHVTSRDVTLGHVTPPDGSPDPSLTPEIQHNTTPRARGEPDLEEITHRRCAMLSEAVGLELWGDVDAFLKRRDYWTWKSWADEMLKLITGTQYTPADLAQVCRDDGALARPIGSPFGLRRFIGNAHRERTMPPAEGKAVVRRGGVGQRSYENAIEALKDIPEAS